MKTVLKVAGGILLALVVVYVATAVIIVYATFDESDIRATISEPPQVGPVSVKHMRTDSTGTEWYSWRADIFNQSDRPRYVYCKVSLLDKDGHVVTWDLWSTDYMLNAQTTTATGEAYTDAPEGTVVSASIDCEF